MNQTLRIGISPCPNDVFIYAGLILGHVPTPGWSFQFEFEDIHQLNQWASEGSFQAIKISFAHLGNVSSQYRLLRCGGALGRGCGPLLLSGGNAFSLQQDIMIPGENTTANALLDFYLRGENVQDHPCKKFQRFDELYQTLLGNRNAQGVVIHEMRFTYEQDGLQLVQDLGAYWETKMQAPIPLGALVLDRHCPLEPRLCEGWVRQSLAWSRSHESEALKLCRQYSQAMNDRVMLRHIETYVNDFSEDLGHEGETAVTFFLKHLNVSRDVF